MPAEACVAASDADSRRTVGGNAQAVAYGEAGWAKVGDATAAPRSNLTALRDALGIEVPRP